jgi:hypothetical protein
VLFLLFAAIPYIFQRAPYRFTVSQAGLAFISVGVGVLLGVVTSILVDRTIYQKLHRKIISEGGTHVMPEHRLYSAMIGSSGIVIGLFWFGWCAGTGQHWAACLAGAIPFAWGNICLFVSVFELQISAFACSRHDQTSAALYLVDVYGPQNGASAMAANGVSRYGMSAVFPLFAVQSKLYAPPEIANQLTFFKCTKVSVLVGPPRFLAFSPCSCYPFPGSSSNGDQRFERRVGTRRWGNHGLSLWLLYESVECTMPVS